MVHDITHVLRPGGLVEFFQNDYHAYDENFQRIKVDMTRIGAPWWPLWIAYLEAAARARGVNTAAGENTADWLRETGEYQELVQNHVWLPVSGINPLHNEFVCASMRVDIMVSFLGFAEPLLLVNGMLMHLSL